MDISFYLILLQSHFMQNENQLIYKFIFASFLIIILIIFFVILQVIYFFKRQNIINNEIQKMSVTHEKEL